MTISIAPGLLDQMRESSGAITITITGPPKDQVRAILADLCNRLDDIRHPEEPDGPFHSLALVRREDPPHLYADMADAEAYPGILEAVIDAAVAAADAEGVTEGELTWSFEEPAL